MITLYDYLAWNVPNEAMNLLERYDMPYAQNEDELVSNLKQFVRVYREEALEKLSEIHPDKDLIMQMVNFSTPYEGNATDPNEFLNASGTMDRISNLEHSLMSGSNNTTPTGLIDKLDLVLGIGIALLTASIFNKD